MIYEIWFRIYKNKVYVTYKILFRKQSLIYLHKHIRRQF